MDTHRLDVIGHAAWALTMFGVLFGMTVTHVAGTYLTATSLASIATVAFGVGALIWWDRKSPDSILGSSKIPRQALLVLIVYGVCLQIGFIGFISLVRGVLIAVYDYGPVLAAAALAPMVLGMLLMIFYGVPRLYSKRPRIVMSSGLLAMSIVIALTMLTRAVGYYPWLGLLLTMFGAANIAASTAWTSAFLALVPKEVIGVRTGISSSVSQAGGAIGLALTGSLLAIYGLADFQRRLVAAGVERSQVEQALYSLDIILNPLTPDPDLDLAIHDRLVAGYQISYLGAFDRVLLIVAVLCLFGAVVMWFGLPHKARPTE